MSAGLFLCMGSWFMWTDVSKMATQKINSEHESFCPQLWNMTDLIEARQVAKTSSRGVLGINAFLDHRAFAALALLLARKLTRLN